MSAFRIARGVATVCVYAACVPAVVAVALVLAFAERPLS